MLRPAPICKDCLYPLTPKERNYYEDRCESCARDWSRRISDWRHGKTEDAELDEKFKGQPRRKH